MLSKGVSLNTYSEKTMRKSESQSLGDILKSYIQENKLQGKMNEIDLISSWELVVGKPLAKYTRNLHINNHILFVETSSSIVRNELLLRKEEIQNRLNEIVGTQLVHKIVFK